MGSDIATDAFQVLLEGELAIERDSKVSWILAVVDGGTVDCDCNLTAGGMQCMYSSFGRAQPEPSCR